jgi:hypothetical protein
LLADDYRLEVSSLITQVASLRKKLENEEWHVYLFYAGVWTPFALVGCISALSFVIIQLASVARSSPI